MRINTLRLRNIIGMCGIALPWIVAILSMIAGYGWPQSISETVYKTVTAIPFMIILGAASITLISYKGYETIDDIVLTVAGIAGFAICIFPCRGYCVADAAFCSMVHNISAIVFFSLLAYNSFFLFTKSTGQMTTKKKIRNIIYRICGIGMIAAFGIMLLPHFRIQTWLVETIALFFFGVSFLTKADIYPFLFCDTAFIEGENE